MLCNADVVAVCEVCLMPSEWLQTRKRWQPASQCCTLLLPFCQLFLHRKSMLCKSSEWENASADHTQQFLTPCRMSLTGHHAKPQPDLNAAVLTLYACCPPSTMHTLPDRCGLHANLSSCALAQPPPTHSRLYAARRWVLTEMHAKEEQCGGKMSQRGIQAVKKRTGWQDCGSMTMGMKVTMMPTSVRRPRGSYSMLLQPGRAMYVSR